MTTNVPRTATFDDLRVGQWVAWLRDDDSDSGAIVRLNDDASADIDGGVRIFRQDCEAGEVTILRDAPAPPVTVRREDYDALVASLDRVLVADTALGRAARALIDNANTGEDA